MTGSGEYSSEELRILLLRHLEGSLSQEEERNVSDLLRTSEKARKELEGLRRIMDTLKTDKTLFCPDPSDIAEFITSGQDPDGKIAGHLNECPSCREEAHSLKSFRPAPTIPPEIWNKISSKLAERSQWAASPESPDRSSGLLAWFSSLFRMPVLAIGSAAAVAVLLVVFLYPRHPPGSMLALSSVSWEADLTTKVPTLSRDRERVALVILLKDFKTPMSQPRIDNLYEALKPDELEQKRYDLVTPSRIKEALGGVASTSTPLQETVDALRKKLGVQRVVVVSLVSEKNQIMITGESMDAASGKPLGKTVEAVANDQTLESTLRRLVYSSLKVNGNAIRR
jgi:hypothetical protein